MARVAAIGLDAAEWRLVEEWMKEGTLPNLRQLQSESAVFELENVREYRSEAIWGAFAEGRHPSTSGRWTNISFNPEIYQALDTGADKSLPFWSREGATPAVIFDIPHTSTRDDEGVTHVTGWGAHSALFPRASRPVGLLRDIDARFGPHPAFERDNVPSWYDQPYLSRLVEACEQGARTRIEIAKHLMESNPDWKFFVTAMSEPHSVGHHAWHGVDPTHQANKTKHAAFAREAMRRTYQSFDKAVGEFRKLIDPDTHLIVFALHGMQANTNDLPAGVLLPELLYRLQFGEPLLVNPRAEQWTRDGSPAIAPDLTWGSELRHMFADSAIGRLKRATYGVLPKSVYRAMLLAAAKAAGRNGPRQVWEDDYTFKPEAPVEEQNFVDDLQYQPPVWYARHWRSMRAFALPTFSDGQVRINLQGRESSGIVPLDQYDAVCDEIIRELRACTDARTGAPMVADIITPLRDDPFKTNAPPADIIVLFNHGVDAIKHPKAGLIGPVPLMRTGEHSSNGFAMISGPGIAPGFGGRRRAVDMPATILDLLGTSLEGVDGTSLLTAREFA